MGGCQGASIRLVRRIYASICATKGIFHFRYVPAFAGRDVRVAGHGALKGVAERRYGLLPRVPCAGFHARAGMPGRIGKPWFSPSRTELLLKI